jgi:hypothetical protein
LHETLLTPGHQILTALGRLIGLCRPSQLKSAHSLAVGRSSTPLRSHAAQSITVRSAVRPEFQSEGHSRASMGVMPEGEIIPVGLADGGSTAALLPRHVWPRYCAVQRVLIASSLFLVQPASQDGETPFRVEHRAPLRIWPKPMSHCEASSVPVLLGHIYQLHAGYDHTEHRGGSCRVRSGPENCKIEWRRMYYRSNPHSATENLRRLHRTRLRHAVGCMCRGTGPYAGW